MHRFALWLAKHDEHVSNALTAVALPVIAVLMALAWAAKDLPQ